jgi:LysM repeat protein
MKKKIIVYLFLLCSQFQVGFTQITEKIKIGNLTFVLSSDAQRNIQNRINLLKENKQKYATHRKQADMYLSLFHEIFESSGLPSDFKYLALLGNKESYTLDFWGILDEKANSFGLQTNSFVDERQNPITFARAIAQTLKKQGISQNNFFPSLLNLISPDFANSWLKGLNILQNLTPNAQIALPNVAPTAFWQFIAFKTAFDQDEKTIKNEYALVIERTRNKTLQQISQEDGVLYPKLKQYNQWLKGDRVPNDKLYDVILPIYSESPTDEDLSFAQENEEREILQAGLENSQIHQVQKGETPASIARKYNISLNQLFAFNNLTQKSRLFVGQNLIVAQKNNTKSIRRTNPYIAPARTENTALLHTVGKGEGLFSIARKYNVSVAQIKQWNNLDNTNIKLNQKLTIFLNQNNNTTPAVSTGVVKPTENTANIRPVQNNNITNKPFNANRSVTIKAIPNTLHVLGMELSFSPKLREAIAKDVERLMRNPTAFLNKVRRADLYIDLIDQQIREMGMPSDFRYLPIQESLLIGDAVSKSNAVGYWQFKEGAAREMGLVINANIDERMHIISSTKAAMQYLKRHQNYFQNWIYTLLSYNMGFTGGKNYVAKISKNIKNMTNMYLDESTHWYIRKFLAHKIAFQNELNIETPERILKPILAKDKTLKEVAQESGIPAFELPKHNLWLKRDNLPADKSYIVIVPFKPTNK